jgi:hypothetical protein
VEVVEVVVALQDSHGKG